MRKRNPFSNGNYIHFYDRGHTRMQLTDSSNAQLGSDKRDIPEMSDFVASFP